jgi:hypothetical protein
MLNSTSRGYGSPALYYLWPVPHSFAKQSHLAVMSHSNAFNSADAFYNRDSPIPRLLELVPSYQKVNEDRLYVQKSRHRQISARRNYKSFVIATSI